MLGPLFTKRLFNEFRDMNNSNEFYTEFDENDMRNITAVLKGPQETPYYGGKFLINVT